MRSMNERFPPTVVAATLFSLFCAGALFADVDPTSVDPDPACLGQALQIKGSFGSEPSRFQIQIRPASGGDPLASYGRRKVNWSASKLTFDLPANAVAPGIYRLTVDTFGESGFGVLRNVQISDCTSGGGGFTPTPGMQPDPSNFGKYVDPNDLKGRLKGNPLGGASTGSSGGSGGGISSVIGPVREPDPAMLEVLQRFRDKRPYVDSSGMIHVPFDLQLLSPLVSLRDYEFEPVGLGNPLNEGEHGQLGFYVRYFGDIGDRRFVVLVTEPDTDEIIGCTESIGGPGAVKPGFPGRVLFWGYFDVEATRARIRTGNLRLKLELRDASAGGSQGDCTTYAKWHDADASNDEITVSFLATMAH